MYNISYIIKKYRNSRVGNKLGQDCAKTTIKFIYFFISPKWFSYFLSNGREIPVWPLKKNCFRIQLRIFDKHQKNTFWRDNETKTNDSVKTKNDIIASGPSGKVHLV